MVWSGSQEPRKKGGRGASKKFYQVEQVYVLALMSVFEQAEEWLCLGKWCRPLYYLVNTERAIAMGLVEWLRWNFAEEKQNLACAHCERLGRLVAVWWPGQVFTKEFLDPAEAFGAKTTIRMFKALWDQGIHNADNAPVYRCKFCEEYTAYCPRPG